MEALHPRPHYLTGHLPSPRMLNSEILKSPGPQMDLQEAVYTLAGAVLFAKHSQFVESLEEHCDLLRRGASLIPRAPVWFNIGSLWALVGDIRRAKDAYELSVNEDREFTISWFCIGTCYFLLRQYGESEDTFRKCLATFKIFRSVKFFDDYSLDFLLAKDDVMWNCNVAKRYSKIQRALVKPETSGLKLRRDHFNLFLGPHKDSFKMEQGVSKTCGAKFRESLSSLHRPAANRKNYCFKPTNYTYVGFPELQENGPKVALRIPVSGRTSTVGSELQLVQPMGDDMLPLQVLPVIPRKGVSAAPIIPFTEENHESLGVKVNSFPLPPTTIRRRSHIPVLSFMAAQPETCRKYQGRISTQHIERERTDTRSNEGFSLQLAQIAKSATTAFNGRQRPAKGRLPLPTFVFPSPSPPSSPEVQGAPQALHITHPSAELSNSDDSNVVNDVALPIQQSTANCYSHGRYYVNALMTSISTNGTESGSNSHAVQTNNDGNEATALTTGSNSTLEAHHNNEQPTHSAVASPRTSLSQETFYSVISDDSSSVAAVRIRCPPPSPSSPVSNSNHVHPGKSQNPQLRRQIFQRMLNFLPVPESGGLAKRRRRHASAVNDMPGMGEK
ncbi:uncharacterized protein PADG_00511 [Paracoccidioides brasiliensis Pb18]|uniref:Uncharacterized protein n=1 Tax=Paracoccidioides brasiliensis (strain Pb18) TaxID=502780 RepID=C1G0X1_PARBD|nr:uncharacterized protein PADG_00511 [Paracoccidioides brasiliensis Pb18]EEH44222.2 hypothetical protein PADG_00511 [Paracoccidioides brasiliensis Pb18]